MKPLLTVVIISWNTFEYIRECIASVLASDYSNIEVILIDNASTDNSIGQLSIGLTPIRLIVNDKNYGCAYAENQGIEEAKGKYISFICGDTKVDPHYFTEVVNTLESDCTIGAVGAKMYVMNRGYRLDTVGEYLTQWGILMQRHAGHEIDCGRFAEQVDIFGIKGAGLTARVDLLQQIGGFPDDYFMFLEETDTEWRIWLAGYRIVFAPKAIIYHATSTSINRHPKKEWLVKYTGTRNYIYTCLKNYGTLNLLRVMPMNLLLWCGVSAKLLCQARFGEAWYVFAGVMWNVFHLPYIYKRRAKAQAIRKVSDAWIFKKAGAKMSLRELAEKALYW